VLASIESFRSKKHYHMSIYDQYLDASQAHRIRTVVNGSG
jgi:hypothetical protein